MVVELEGYKLTEIDSGLYKETELVTVANLTRLLIDKRLSNIYPNLSKKNPAVCLSKILNIRKKKPVQWFIKRAIDIAGSVLGILLIFPLLVIIAVAIKLDSKGPILFKQKRIGINGKEFYMYKFRTMHKNAEKKLEVLKKYNETNSGMFKMLNDPRVTRVGTFLRKYSLDELAQLLNVIRGEMSLVGPRPPLPSEVEDYERWHHVRFATLPGLTGMWQVNGRSSIKNFDTVVVLDFQYIENWSILLDFKILFKTIPVVFLGKDSA